jgi:hypothetical protein
MDGESKEGTMTLTGFLAGDLMVLACTYLMCCQRYWHWDHPLWVFFLRLEMLAFGIGALILPFLPPANL